MQIKKRNNPRLYSNFMRFYVLFHIIPAHERNPQMLMQYSLDTSLDVHE